MNGLHRPACRGSRHPEIHRAGWDTLDVSDALPVAIGPCEVVVMQQLDSDLWVAEAPLRFLGLEVGARMTVIRLPDGGLVLHSPIAVDPSLRQEVDSLGRVAHVVAPNKFHHLYVSGWKDAFPEASVWVAPGLESKRSDLPIAGVLGEQTESAWSAVLDQIPLQGFPFANEVVFFHRPSRTLVLTDIAFNVGPDAAPITRFFFKLNGVYGRLSPTIVEKLLIRDRAAFRAGLERILAWPFERVIVAHGDVKESGGRAELERGYAWLLDN